MVTGGCGKLAIEDGQVKVLMVRVVG